MPVRKIIYINDERLRQEANEVKLFTHELKQLSQDMLETMQAHSGLGLAGPQIGLMQRIFVAKIPLPADPEVEPHPQAGKSFVLINPEIISRADEWVEGQEGCLSIPTWYGLVDRPIWVQVKAQDVEGNPKNLKVEGLLARIFCHEIDHLNGVLFLDHIKDRDKLWQILPEEQEQEAQTKTTA